MDFRSEAPCQEPVRGPTGKGLSETWIPTSPGMTRSTLVEESARPGRSESGDPVGDGMTVCFYLLLHDIQ